MECQVCHKNAAEYKCSRCQSAFYCGLDCGQQGWTTGGHYKECAALAMNQAKVGPKYKGGDKDKKKKKRGDDYLPEGGYPDIDTETHLEKLRQKWQETSSQETKDYIVKHIKKMNDKNQLMYKNKPLDEFIYKEYSEKKMDALVKKYDEADDEFDKQNTNSDLDEDERMNDDDVERIIAFNDDPNFSLYYDLANGGIIGPLSIYGLEFVDKDGKRKRTRKPFSGHPGTARALDDAQKIRQYDKDPSKVEIYSK